MMSQSDSAPLLESHLSGLKLLNRGKVRDMYAIDDEHMLIVATDRLSAFDVVLSDPIPGKGAVLTALTNFWLDRFTHIIPDHRARLALESVLSDSEERAAMRDRATIVRKLNPLPIEAIVRGYIIGSGWKDYQKTGQVSGINLPTGLRQADQLPQPIFTPSTKADIGEHDQNINFQDAVERLGEDLAEQVKSTSLQLYGEGAAYARQRGIIIADTKFEFGTDKDGNLVLIDEVLTPDSSRFWPVDSYQPGSSPASFDKQFVRDYLETLDWDKTPPAPPLPADIIDKTSRKYREARDRLTAR